MNILNMYMPEAPDNQIPQFIHVYIIFPFLILILFRKKIILENREI